MVGTAWYRVGQFLQALTARVSEEEIEKATRILAPEARSLFRRQAIQDRRHALAVYHALQRAGHTNPHLLAAALLHDVGKASIRLPAWQRAVIVLLHRLAPRLLGRLGGEEARGHAQNRPTKLAEAPSRSWRPPFGIHAQHPEIGALWAQAAGCSALTVALIRRHQDRLVSCQTEEEDKLLAALQVADGRN